MESISSETLNTILLIVLIMATLVGPTIAVIVQTLMNHAEKYPAMRKITKGIQTILRAVIEVFISGGRYPFSLLMAGSAVTLVIYQNVVTEVSISAVTTIAMLVGSTVFGLVLVLTDWTHDMMLEKLREENRTTIDIPTA